jgi:hypothetical protein
MGRLKALGIGALVGASLAIGGLAAGVGGMSPARADCFHTQQFLFELSRYDSITLTDPRPDACNYYGPVIRSDGNDPNVNREVWRATH